LRRLGAILEAMRVTEPGESDDVLERVPRQGDLLEGKFRVERVVGTGGFGVVLGVEHIQLKQRFALKLLHPIFAPIPVVSARFLREAQTCARIHDEHVVRVTDVGTLVSGTPYLVMEFLEGRSLREILLDRGRVTADEAIEYVRQACAGVAAAHRLGIVHRDLKPENLFVVENAGKPQLKVLDFGISKTVCAEDDPQSLSLTTTHSRLGSPHYMAPEQVRDARMVDRRSDVWSLGVVLHELVSGSPPFDGGSAGDVYAAVVVDAPAKLLAKAPDAPPALEEIVLRCLDKDPSKRWSTIDELAAALAALASGGHVETAPRKSPAPPRPRPSFHGVIAIACFVLLAAIAAVFLAFR
jgi:serine/threonine-protein kinase